jgi:hypothetical protein
LLLRTQRLAMPMILNYNWCHIERQSTKNTSTFILRKKKPREIWLDKNVQCCNKCKQYYCLRHQQQNLMYLQRKIRMKFMKGLRCQILSTRSLRSPDNFQNFEVGNSRLPRPVFNEKMIHMHAVIAALRKRRIVSFTGGLLSLVLLRHC